VSCPPLPLHSGLGIAQLLAEANKTLEQALAAGGDCLQGAGAEAQTAPDTPAFNTLPESEAVTPAPPAIATPTDIQRGLQALLDGRRPEVAADALARAVLPFLDNWNQTRGKHYTALIEQLKSALESAGEDEPMSTTLPDSANQSR